MRAYDIIEFNKEYKYVVFATSYENPIDELDEIEMTEHCGQSCVVVV